MWKKKHAILRETYLYQIIKFVKHLEFFHFLSLKGKITNSNSYLFLFFNLINSPSAPQVSLFPIQCLQLKPEIVVQATLRIIVSLTSGLSDEKIKNLQKQPKKVLKFINLLSTFCHTTFNIHSFFQGYQHHEFFLFFFFIVFDFI